MITETRVKELIASAFQLDATEVGETANSDTVPEWDSLGHLQLILLLEEELGQMLDPEHIVDMRSYPDIVKILSVHYG